MKIESLLKDSSRATIDKATERAIRNDELFREMIFLSLNKDTKFALRASRVLHFCAVQKPNILKPYLNDVLKGLKNIKNDSIRGNLFGVFTEIELPNNEELLGELTQICFDLLNGRSERESLSVYSLDVLYKICKFHPELKNELVQNIQALLPHKKAAFHCRGNEILRKINKMK